MAKKQKKSELLYIIAAIATIITAIYTLSQCPKQAPTFGIKTSNQNAEMPIVIIAKNTPAKRKQPLDVCWDGFYLDEAAFLASSSDVYEWKFTVSKENRLPDFSKIDGVHMLQCGFEGSFSTPLKVSLYSKQSEKAIIHKKEILQSSFSLTLPEKIEVESVKEFLPCPRFFCATKSNFFLIPNSETGTIMIFEKNLNSLNLKKILRLNLSNLDTKALPMYCSFSFNEQNGDKFGLICQKKIFIFYKTEKGDFSLIKEFECKNMGYDIKFTADGDQIIISGFLADKDKNPFELYTINIKSGQIDYLLPSPKKYGLKTYEKYIEEYFIKRTLPAIGIKGFFDIQGNDLFFVWEGALKIIKFNLRSKESMAFGYETLHYKKPNGSKLNDFYIIKEYLSAWKDQEKFAYIRNIFATTQHIFLIYETAKNEIRNGSRFRLQMYNLNGQFQGDVSIPGTSTTTPSQPMWLDKENHELYAFSKEANSDTGSFTILKYKIKF